MSDPRNLSSDNIFRKVFDGTTETLRVSGTFAPPVGGATEAKQDDQITVLESIDNKLTSPIAVSGSFVVTPPATYAVTSLIDASVTNITTSTYLQLVASTTQTTVKIQSIDDIGEYMALYVGAPASETLLCALPLGGGEVEVNVPTGSRISIKSLKNNITSGNIILNLLK